jgi:hypothetical protein
MPVGEVDIDREVLDLVTPDSDDSRRSPAGKRVSRPALTGSATLASRQDPVWTVGARFVDGSDRAPRRRSGPTGTIPTSP